MMNCTDTGTATTLARLLDAWDDGTFADRHAAALARLMDARLSARDAFLVHLIAPSTPREDIIDMAEHPHRPDTAGKMDAALTHAFTTGDYDRPRLHESAVTIIGYIDGIPMDVPRAQTEAVAAYLLWWSGDAPAAVAHAFAALAADETCSLAAIVLTAFHHGINPA